MSVEVFVCFMILVCIHRIHELTIGYASMACLSVLREAVDLERVCL